MDATFSFADMVDVIGAVLLHFVWQGAVIGSAYALARPFFREVSARYRLGMSALIALALCPLVTVIYLWPTAGVAATNAASALPTIGATMLAAADRAAEHWPLRAALPWLVGIWSLGVIALASRSLWQWRRLVRIVREAVAPSDEWSTRLADLRARFGVRRHVQLLCSPRAITPMLIGWLRPVVLLPASMMTGFSPDQIDLIIAHELGHVCRWDYVANLFQVVLETVLFYHPVVHWISHDVRNARESCCDDLVLELAQGNPLAYARTLADLEELRHDESILVPALGASGGVLLARIRHIVGVSETQDRLPRTNSWPIMLIGVALALFAWRQQNHSTMPQPVDVAQSLASAPAKALALISGNATLADAPAVALPKIENVSAPPMTKSAPVETAPPAVAEPVRIERPRVEVASASRLDRVRNLIAPAPMTPVSLQVAEPEPVAAPALLDAAEQLAPLHIVSPVYPPRAESSGIEGNVELEFSVTPQGTVADVRVVRAKPAGIFEAAARAAISEWRFVPPVAQGRHTQNFAFALRGKNIEEKCQQPTGSMICRRPGE